MNIWIYSANYLKNKKKSKFFIILIYYMDFWTCMNLIHEKMFIVLKLTWKTEITRELFYFIF